MTVGWYPDPDDPAARRYWDGQAWSPPLAETDLKSRRRAPWIVGAVALAAVVVVGVVLLVQHLSSGPKPITGYHQQASVVAKRLKTCRSVKRISATVARCVSASGSYLAVETEDDATVQTYGVALIKDGSSGDCVVVLKGVIIAAATEDALTEVVGEPEQFASDNHGYLLCPVP